MRFPLALVALCGCSFSGASNAPDAGIDAAIDASVDAAPPLGACGASGVVRDAFDEPIRDAYWIGVGDSGIALDGSDVSFTTQGFVLGEFVGFIGRRWFDFTGSETSVEILERPINGARSIFKLELDINASFGFVIGDAGIVPYMQSIEGIVTEGTPVVFDAGLHRFLRVREEAKMVHFEARGSAQAEWSELFVAVAPDYLTSVRPVLGIFSDAAPSPATASYDNFNVDVIESRWCELSELGTFSDASARFDWVPFVFDLETAPDCQINATFATGTIEVTHFIGSSNCVAAVDSRRLYQVGDSMGVSVNFTRQQLGSTTRGFLELTALDGANPRVYVEITDTELCARAQTSGPVIPSQCIDLIAQSRVGLRRVGDDVIFAAGDKAQMTDFATIELDASMPLKVGIGAESFGNSTNPSSVVMVFSGLSIDSL